MSQTAATPGLHGVLAAFGSAEELLSAVRAAYASGYRRMDAYTPFPLDGLAEALGQRAERIPYIVLIGALLGGAAGYLLQYYSVVIDYPINVGGRPYHAWPSFLIVTFETTILGGALAALFGMLALNRLPQYYHPVFNARAFSMARGDRFFLCIEAADPSFDVDSVHALLVRLRATSVETVPP